MNDGTKFFSGFKKSVVPFILVAAILVTIGITIYKNTAKKERKYLEYKLKDINNSKCYKIEYYAYSKSNSFDFKLHSLLYKNQGKTSEIFTIQKDDDPLVFFDHPRHFQNKELKHKISLKKGSILSVKELEPIEKIRYKNICTISYFAGIKTAAFLTIKMNDGISDIFIKNSSWVMLGVILFLLISFLTIYIKQYNERKHLQEKLKFKQEKQDIIQNFNYFAHYANDVIVLADLSGMIIWINYKGEKTYGYTPEEYEKFKLSSLCSPNVRETSKDLIQLLAENESIVYETLHITKDGKEFPVEVSAQKIDAQGVFLLQAIIRDISERKAAEKRIFNLNRLYTVLGNINQTIVREKDLTSIFNATCRIIVENGGFNHAWICDCTTNPKLFTHYLAKGSLSFSRSHHQLFCEEACIESHFRDTNYELNHIVINDLHNDTRKFIWKEEALSNNFQSAAFFPLHSHSRLKGILGIFSDESAFFDTEKLKLLDEIAIDLSYSIEIKENERKQQKLYIKEKELHQLLQNIINTTPDWIFVKDKEHRFTMVNKAFAENLGKTPADIIGRFDYEIWGEEACFGNEEKGIIGFHKDDNRVLNGENIYNPEDRVIDLTGKEHIFDNYKYPLYDIQGNITGILGFARDITKRLQTEKLIRENEYKFRLITENVIDAIFQIDYFPEQHFSYVSPSIERITGYTPEEFYAQPNLFEKLIYKKEHNFFKDLKHPYDNVSNDIKCQITKKTGEQIWLEIRNVPFYNENGELTSIEGIARDITESKKLEQELINARNKAEEMNRLKTNFLANMSHELRTPLNGILGFSELLKNELKNPEYVEWAEMMNANGTRLLETLDLILNLSKLESENIEIKTEEVSPFDVIREVYTAFEFSARKKGLTLTIDSNDQYQKVLTDQRMLREVISNLVNNAIKYTPKGSVSISLNFKKSKYEISVKDTGIGISKDKINIIFDEFRQESEGYNRTYEGTGLGLTITKRFVELLGGTISVKSTQYVGSSFTITFPLIKTKQNQKNHQQSNLNSGPAELTISENTHILLVEDDDMSQMLVEKFLGQKTKLKITESGIKALEIISNNKFDIILMDINLGEDLNGIEITKKIRKIPGYENTPIIALTAFALERDKEYFLTNGFTYYLSKPFTKNDFYILLNSIF